MALRSPKAEAAEQKTVLALRGIRVGHGKSSGVLFTRPHIPPSPPACSASWKTLA